MKYEGALIDQVDEAIPDKKTQDAIKKKLKKVASKDGKAIDQLKKGGPALKIKKYIHSATKRKRTWTGLSKPTSASSVTGSPKPGRSSRPAEHA